MHALAANVAQLVVLGLGVSLLVAWVNHLRAIREENSSREPERNPAEGSLNPTANEIARR
jgi:hypothetical protein